MNGLSWFLYFAEVLPNLSNVIWSIGAYGGVTLYLFSLAWWVVVHENPDAEEKATRDSTKFLKFVSYKLSPAIVFLIVISVLIPSKETIYLIAGSEASEYAVTSEYGQEVLGDIKDIIKAQLNNLKDSDSE